MTPEHPDVIIQRLGAALAGRYRVERELGAGGMATVYLAHDERHDRDVAIKVLHPDLAAALGGERFLTEIKTTARLQHPHILPLLDSGDADGLLFYVMPYVSGESLRDRLTRERQLPIEDALRIAREVADALGAAHALGIVHRDVKPENILLQGGHALVADFGIALAVQSAGGARMTQTGLSLGTPQYMSPEQATGERTIDHRADVYALGAVTYEMLTGDPPFTGSSMQAVVAKLVSSEPERLTVIRKSIPPGVESAVLQALAKLPADRPASAAQFSSALTAQPTLMTGAYASPRAARGAHLWQGIAAMAVLAAAGAGWYATRTKPTPPRVVRFALPPASTSNSSSWIPDVSPDGSTIAYADALGDDASHSKGIRLRRIDREEGVLVPGTANASGVAFSPDGLRLAYTNTASELHTIALDGSDDIRVAAGVSWFYGVHWSSDGYLYYCDDKDLSIARRVSATGGTPETVFTLPDSADRRGGRGQVVSPITVPGSDVVVFSVSGIGRADGGIVAYSRATKTFTPLAVGMHVLTVIDGYLLYYRVDGTVLAIPFDAKHPRAGETPTPVLTGLATQGEQAFVAVSRSGTIIYQSVTSALSQLVWVARNSVETAVDTSLRRNFTSLAISPEGGRLALTIVDADQSSAIWTYDLARRGLVRVTPQHELAFRPQWTPDGQRLMFATDHQSASGKRRIFSVATNRDDTLALVLSRERSAQEISWPTGGDYFAFREGYDDGATRRDIFAAKKGDTIATPLAVTNADESNPKVSPDGKWIAYALEESGRAEVFVMPFPRGGERHQVSADGGYNPVWGPSGKQLYFISDKRRLMSAPLVGGSGNPLGAPQELFDVSRYGNDRNGQSYDVAIGEQKFLFVRPPERASLSVVVDWWSEAKGRLGRGGR